MVGREDRSTVSVRIWCADCSPEMGCGVQMAKSKTVAIMNEPGECMGHGRVRRGTVPRPAGRAVP
eukprot:COSAG05_NODE_19520_length_291_cov_0.947917_1_plen_64_part_10